MGKRLVYSVWDSKVNAYASPFFMRTRAEAIRGWEAVANDPSTEISKYPHDFHLMELASFDEDTGEFTNCNGGPMDLGAAVHMQKKVSDATLLHKPVDLNSNQPSAVN